MTMAVAAHDSFTVDVNFEFDFVTTAGECFAAPVAGRIAIGFLIVDFGVDNRSVTSLTRPLKRTGDVRLKDAYAVDFAAIAVTTALLLLVTLVVMALLQVVPVHSTVFNLMDFLLMFELAVTVCDAFAL